MKNDNTHIDDLFLDDNETSEDLLLSNLSDEEINAEYQKIFGNK